MRDFEQERMLGLLELQIHNIFRYNITKKGENLLKEYCVNGDIESFMEQGHALFNLRNESTQQLDDDDDKFDDVLTFFSVFFYGGNVSFEKLKYRLNVFTEWVLEDSAFRGSMLRDFQSERSLDSRFNFIKAILGDFGKFFTN